MHCRMRSILARERSRNEGWIDSSSVAGVVVYVLDNWSGVLGVASIPGPGWEDIHWAIFRQGARTIYFLVASEVGSISEEVIRGPFQIGRAHV